jgi:methylmalonyl-CoA/ethylmalonyl-CoA epimerase
MTSPQPEIQLARIAQIAINVHDVQRAVGFYRDVLGLRFLFQAGEKMAFFDCAGTRLMLSLPETPEYDHAGSILYYQVEDIAKTYDALRSRGARFEGEPHLIARMADHDLWMAFGRDSEANVFALMSEVRQPASV